MRNLLSNHKFIIPAIFYILAIMSFLGCENPNKAKPGKQQASFIDHTPAAEIKRQGHLSGGPSKVIYLNGAHDLTISAKSIAGGTGACITLINCHNILITQNKLYRSADVGIRLYNCHHVRIYHNYFADLSTGVYAEKTNEGKIQIEHNQFLNMQGPYPRGQFVQFNNINGPGNQIDNNRCENIRGKSNPEDGISLYQSNGTKESPIEVKGNWIRGGGPSRSGGGIMLGDNGGSYQIAAGNVLVDPGQYGIAVSGGDHNAIIDNSIYARPQSFTNVGLYVAGYNGVACTNTTVERNKVRFFNNKYSQNNAWLGPGIPYPAGWATNFWGARIGPDVLPSKIFINN